MIFPNSVNGSFNTEENTRLGRSFVFDFETGQTQVVGGVVQETTELQAAKQWIELLVRTTLDKYVVYKGTGFGTSIQRYIGYRSLPFGFIESEFQREVEEGAQLNPAIEGISNFVLTRTTRGLIVEFTVNMKNKDIFGMVINTDGIY